MSTHFDNANDTVTEHAAHVVPANHVSETASNTRRHELAWRLLTWIALLLLCGAAARMALDSGITLDEDVHRQYGDAILNWFRSGFTDARATTFGNLFLYGGLFDLIAQFVVSLEIVPIGTFELRHVLTALTAVSGIVATWHLASCFGGRRAGLIAALCLVLTPTWVGHSLFNPKDVPFAAAATFALLGAAHICLGSSPLSWTSALRAGGFIGLALAVRPGGMFLLAYPVVAALGAAGIEAQRRRQQGESPVPLCDALTILSRLLVACGLAWALMLSAWPWAQLQPFSRPLTAAAEARHFIWRNLVLFKGERIWSFELPSDYLITWFRITLPDFYLLGALVALPGLLVVLRKPRFQPHKLLFISLLVLSIAAPMAAVAITKPIVYDAHRHFLFLFPPLAALIGIGTSSFLSLDLSRYLRAGVVIGLATLASFTVSDMIQLHPYEYIYFNRLFGGLPAAVGKFETDYWGAANREAFAWVVENYKPRRKKHVSTAMCYSRWQLKYLKAAWGERAARFKVTKDDDGAEIFIATTRDRCNEKPGRPIHAVTRQGVPLVYVLAR